MCSRESIFFCSCMDNYVLPHKQTTSDGQELIQCKTIRWTQLKEFDLVGPRKTLSVVQRAGPQNREHSKRYSEEFSCVSADSRHVDVKRKTTAFILTSKLKHRATVFNTKCIACHDQWVCATIKIDKGNQKRHPFIHLFFLLYCIPFCLYG